MLKSTGSEFAGFPKTLTQPWMKPMTGCWRQRWQPVAVCGRAGRPWRAWAAASNNAGMGNVAGEHRADEDRVDESVRARPAGGLLPIIAHYTGYRQRGVGPARHRGLPSPFLTLIFTLDDPLMLARHPDPRQPPGTYQTLAAGLHTSPALVVHQGSQSGVQVGLSPLGARLLLGLPAGELTDTGLEAADLLGPVAGEIQDQMRAAPGWPERFGVLDRALLGRLAAADLCPEISAEVRFAWRRLLHTGGSVAISGLAAQSGWSDRHLRAAFRAQIGRTPKAAARVIGFHRARRLLQQRTQGPEQPVLASLAAECGYYDQAHLARDFRSLAGCPPRRWLAEEFRNVQAEPLAMLKGSVA